MKTKPKTSYRDSAIVTVILFVLYFFIGLPGMLVMAVIAYFRKRRKLLKHNEDSRHDSITDC
jgi:hypothetical protein